MAEVVPRDAELSRVIEHMTAWTVLVAQYNGMVADRVGVGPTDLQCLYALALHGPTTVGTLAERVNLTSGSASRMVERLDAAGHVRRVRDSRDRRRVLIEAVPAAVELVGRHYQPLTDRLRADLADFDAAELARFTAFFRAAEASTDAVIRDPGTGSAPRHP